MADDPLDEAVQAIQNDENGKARQLLTDLLRADPTRVDAWLWLSSVVETHDERIHCLREALTYDPKNEAARRGLVLLGAMSPAEAGLQPQAISPQPWRPHYGSLESTQSFSISPSPRLYAFAGLLFILIILFTIGLINSSRPRVYTPLPLPGTPIPSATYPPTGTPVVRSPTPTFVGPTPLWMFLEATYTATPLYINTPHPITEAYRGGIRALERGDWKAVINYMQQVSAIQPASADVYYYTGEAYRSQGDYKNALATYEKAIQAQPSFAPAYLGRARVNLATGDFDGVQTDLDMALTNDPNLGEAYLVQAEYALTQKDAEAALTALLGAEKILPGSPLIPLYRAQADLLLRQPGEAIDQGLQAHDRDFTLLAAYRVLGEAYLANGQAGPAISNLRTYLLYKDQDAGAYTLMGGAHAALKEYPQALSAFNQALEIDDMLIDAYLQRGLVYLEQNNELALDDMSSALKIDPQSFAANLGKGRALAMLGRHVEAFTQYNKAEALAADDPEKASLYFYRAISEEAINRPAQAIQDWQALLALPKGSASIDWLLQANQHLQALITPQPTA